MLDKKSIYIINRAAFSVIACIICTQSFAQSFNNEQVEMAMYIERMITTEPFEGCRIFKDYDCAYLLSVVILDKEKYKQPMAMNRVAQVKSQRNAGEFFNGTQSWSECTIYTPRCPNKNIDGLPEVIDIIRTNTTGYVRQMQLLTSFDGEGATKIFVYYKPLNATDAEK